MTRRAGFTLIELSIVLVIIGLIIGGIVVGKGLIEIAQNRKIMSQMDSYELAYNTFMLKYNCIPGDCARAADFSLGPSGNGDSYIGSISYSSHGAGTTGCLVYNGWECATNLSVQARRIYSVWDEMQQVWVHLGNANLIPATYDSLTLANNPGAAVVGYALTPQAMQLDAYFPKAANGRHYLIAFMWASKLYVRTGMNGLISTGSPMYAGQGGSTIYSDATLTSAQMMSIHAKKGYVPIGGVNASSYSNAAAAGQRVFATGLYSTSAAVEAFQWQQGDGGCFVKNVDLYTTNGYCDMLWQIAP